jgi:hypothetical protein
VEAAMQVVIGIENDDGTTAWYRVALTTPDAVDIDIRPVDEDPTVLTDLFTGYTQHHRTILTAAITGELVEGRYADRGSPNPTPETVVVGHHLGGRDRALPGSRR